MLSIEVGVWGGVCQKKKKNNLKNQHKPQKARGIVVSGSFRSHKTN